MMITKTVSELKENFDKISALAKRMQEPICITETKEGGFILMDIETFEKREEMIRLKAYFEIGERSRLYGDNNMTLQEAKEYFKNLHEQNQ